MEDKSKIVGLAGTLIFHVLLILLLFLITYKHPIVDELGGVLVQFGNVNMAQGTFEPKNTGEVPEVQPVKPVPVVPPVKPEVKEELLVQNQEETVALEEERKKKEKIKKEEAEQRRIEAEQRKKEDLEKKRVEEEKRKALAIQNKVTGAFGSGTVKDGNQGTSTSGTGNQGNPFGNSTTGKTDGVGGMGSYDLDGRSIGGEGLPMPSYQAQDEGKIVISITVDPNGNVISTEIGKGTTIDNSTLRKDALSAAKRAKFNSITGTNNQVGTITYRFNLK